MIVFAETPRLCLRSLEESDLPRLVELIDDWDIIRWLAVVPYPYTLKNAEDYYAQQAELYRKDMPECFVIASRADNTLIGAVGLHSPLPNPTPDNGALGYWLGKEWWGQGFMVEAVDAIVTYGFDKHPERDFITAVTDTSNQASQSVLRKAGFDYIGNRPRPEQCLRGSEEVMAWQKSNARRAATVTKTGTSG